MPKKVFTVQTFETAFLIELHFLGSPESENHIFSSWFVYESVISTKTNNCRKFKFGTLKISHTVVLQSDLKN